MSAAEYFYTGCVLGLASASLARWLYPQRVR
jgi:hypothetical protein